MAKFTFTSPQGQSYDVEGPDGATQEQAFAILQQHLGAAAGGAPSVDAAFAAGNAHNLIPGSENAPAPSKAPDASLAGVPGAVLTTLSAIPATAAGAVAGAAKTLTSGNFGTPEGIAEGEKTAQDVANRFTYQPSPAGAATLEAAGDVLDRSKLAGLNPAEVPAIAEATKPAAAALKSELAAEDAAMAQSAATARAAKATAAAPTVSVLQKAKGLGLKLIPAQTDVGGYKGAANAVLSSLGGKTRTEQDISLANAPAVNRVVERHFGVDEPLVPTTIDESGQATGPLLDIRNAAVEQGYDPVRQVGQIQGDQALYNRLDQLGARARNAAAGDTSGVFKDQVTPIMEGLKQPTYDSSALIDRIGVLRDQAASTTDRGMKQALYGAANAFEDLLDRSLPPGSDLLNNFRAARTKIAQSYDVAPSLTPSGDVNMQTLAARGKSTTKAPLSGDLGTLSDFARTQSKAVQPVARLGGPTPYSPVDLGIAAITGKPEYLGTIVGRPLVRKLLTSDWYQRKFVRPQDYTQPGMIERLATSFAGGPSSAPVAPGLELAGPGDYVAPATAAGRTPLADKASGVASNLRLGAEPAPAGNEIDIGPFLRERRLEGAGSVERAAAAEGARQADEAHAISYDPVPGDYNFLGRSPLTVDEIAKNISLGATAPYAGGIDYPGAGPSATPIERAIADEAIRRSGANPDLLAPILRDLASGSARYGAPVKTFNPRGG